MMAEPFKLALVGIFSFDRPPMDLIGNFFFTWVERIMSEITT